jgi:hypothetical protein
MAAPKRPDYCAEEADACRAMKRRCRDSFAVAFEEHRCGAKRAAESLEQGPSKRRAPGVSQAFLDGVAFAERTIIPQAVERAVEQQLEAFRAVLTEQRAALSAAYDREVAAMYARAADSASRPWIM